MVLTQFWSLRVVMDKPFWGMGLHNTFFFWPTEPDLYRGFGQIIIVKEILREFMSTARWRNSTIPILRMKLFWIKSIMFSFIINGFFDAVESFLSSMDYFEILLEWKDLKGLGLAAGTFTVNENGDLLHWTYCYKLLLESSKVF